MTSPNQADIQVRPAPPRIAGFTLVELLVVVGVISLLVSILLPSLTRARVLAQVAKSQVELNGIGTALEAYHLEQEAYPPCRASCNADMIGHEFQLPVELANGGYLARGEDLRRMVPVEDPFNPAHTYKYRAPGDLIVNGSPVRNGSKIWVPDAFPGPEPAADLASLAGGTWHRYPDQSPVAWALWSVGPGGPGTEKASSPRGPVSRLTWSRGGSDDGIICRVMAADGRAVSNQQ